MEDEDRESNGCSEESRRKEKRMATVKGQPACPFWTTFVARLSIMGHVDTGKQSYWIRLERLTSKRAKPEVSPDGFRIPYRLN
jgi:hypothetical protein